MRMIAIKMINILLTKKICANLFHDLRPLNLLFETCLSDVTTIVIHNKTPDLLDSNNQTLMSRFIIENLDGRDCVGVDYRRIKLRD